MIKKRPLLTNISTQDCLDLVQIVLVHELPRNLQRGWRGSRTIVEIVDSGPCARLTVAIPNGFDRRLLAQRIDLLGFRLRLKIYEPTRYTVE